MAYRYIKKESYILICALVFAILAVAETRVVTIPVRHPVTFQIQVSGKVNRFNFLVVENETVDPCVIPLPTDKLGLLAPYIGLAATILVTTVATPVQIKHARRRKKLHIYGSSGFSETTTATGPTAVNRSDPYDPENHRMQIGTEIVSVCLTANCTHVESSTVFESPSKASTGAIGQQVAAQGFPADGFFDVYIEIKTVSPYPFAALQNGKPSNLSAAVTNILPCESTYENLATIPLEDNQDNVVGAILATVQNVGASVGGIVIPVDKFDLLDPCIGLASTTLIGAVVTVMYLTKEERSNEHKFIQSQPFFISSVRSYEP